MKRRIAMKVIKLAIIGVGARGDMLLTDAILPQKRCTVTAVFMIFYGISYLITARTYYKIVR